MTKLREKIWKDGVDGGTPITAADLNFFEEHLFDGNTTQASNLISEKLVIPIDFNSPFNQAKPYEYVQTAIQPPSTTGFSYYSESSKTIIQSTATTRNYMVVFLDRYIINFTCIFVSKTANKKWVIGGDLRTASMLQIGGTISLSEVSKDFTVFNDNTNVRLRMNETIYNAMKDYTDVHAIIYYTAVINESLRADKDKAIAELF